MKPSVISPIKKLRQFVASHSALVQFSTQRGFGGLIGRSEQYVKALESKPKISAKLAQQIEVSLGVSADWLLSPERWSEPIPATDGKPLGHGFLLDKLKRDTGFSPESAEGVWAPAIPGINPYEYAVEGLLKSWKPILIGLLENRERTFFVHLLEKLNEAQLALSAIKHEAECEDDAK